MTQKEITINGKTYPVIFTMKTVLGYEDIIGHSFFNDSKFATFKEKIALIIAAIIAANGNANITFDDIVNINSVEGMNDIVKAFNIVMELSAEFFHIPVVEQGKNKKKGKEKNA